MRAAAEFHRIGAACVLAHREYPHLVAVFLAKERHRAVLHRFVRRHEACLNGRILPDDAVDFRFRRRDFLPRHRLGVADIKAQFVRRDKRSLLCDMLAQLVAQRCMQQVRCRMVGADARATFRIDAERHRVADLKRRLDKGFVRVQIVHGLLRINDFGCELAAELRRVPVSPICPPDSP